MKTYDYRSEEKLRLKNENRRRKKEIERDLKDKNGMRGIEEDEYADLSGNRRMGRRSYRVLGYCRSSIRGKRVRRVRLFVMDGNVYRELERVRIGSNQV